MVLREPFLRSLEPELRAEMAGLDELEQQLGRVWAEAREAWPELALPLEDFLGYLAGHLRPDLPPVERLAHLHGPDLYLSCACARGSDQAIALFERHHLEEMQRAVGRLGLDADARSELLQEIREKLFVARAGRPPAITQYAGRGSLGGWLRVTCTNVGLNRLEALQRGRREIPADERSLGVLAAGADDPELQLLKTLYRVEFRRAFKQAWAAQPARDRTLLLLSHLERLSIDVIARMYQVHRATAARWLNQARQGLMERTRAVLAEQLGLAAVELTSILGLIGSHLDVTLSSLAEDTPGPVTGDEEP